MIPKQVAEFVNVAVQQVLGESALVKEDLTNVTDVGEQLTNAQGWVSYIEALVNHIGKVIFVARNYEGILPKLQRKDWEYGSILEKISTDLPEANDTDFMNPTNGAVYTQDKFTKAVVRAKFFNGRLILEVTCPSITEDQLKQSFSNATQLNSFVSMLFTACENAMQIKIEALTLALIRAQIIDTIHADYGSNALSSMSGVKAVNLLKLYNDEFSGSLTIDTCMHNPDFLRFAGEKMRLYISRMAKMSTLFNIEGRERFTKRDLLHVILWSDFVSATTTYLQSSTFHDEMLALPYYEEVPYWQGTGLSYEEAGKLKGMIGDYEIDGGLKILGTFSDRDALVIANLERWTPSHYNNRMHFWNYWFQLMVGLLRDNAENFVVFFVA